MKSVWHTTTILLFISILGIKFGQSQTIQVELATYSNRTVNEIAETAIDVLKGCLSSNSVIEVTDDNSSEISGEYFKFIIKLDEILVQVPDSQSNGFRDFFTYGTASKNTPQEKCRMVFSDKVNFWDRLNINLTSEIASCILDSTIISYTIRIKDNYFNNIEKLKVELLLNDGTEIPKFSNDNGIVEFQVDSSGTYTFRIPNQKVEISSGKEKKLYKIPKGGSNFDRSAPGNSTVYLNRKVSLYPFGTKNCTCFSPGKETVFEQIYTYSGWATVLLTSYTGIETIIKTVNTSSSRNKFKNQGLENDKYVEYYQNWVNNYQKEQKWKKRFEISFGSLVLLSLINGTACWLNNNDNKKVKIGPFANVKIYPNINSLDNGYNYSGFNIVFNF